MGVHTCACKCGYVYTQRLILLSSIYVPSFCLVFRMLDEFDKELEETDSRLRALTSRVRTAIRKSGGQCVCMYCVVCVCVQMRFLR